MSLPSARILHASKGFWPNTYGGIPSAVAALCAACPGSDSRVVTCAPVGSDTVVEGTSLRCARSFGEILSWPLSPGWPLRFWQEARAADLVVLHAPFALAEIAAGLYLPSRSVLAVHWHASITRHKHLGKLPSMFTRSLLERADAIVVSSPMMAAEPQLGAHRDKIAMIPFGIDVRRWTAPLTAAQTERITMLRACFPRLVVAVGPLTAYKGLDVLIEAMLNVDAHLLLIGEGPCRAKLERQIDEAGIGSKITLCGAVSHDDLRIMFRAAQVFALPSVSPNETFGIAQLEAMACGLPVVNTALPTGVPWVARHNKEALTVAAEHAHSLSDAITCLLDDPNLAQRLGHGGYQRVSTVFARSAFEMRVRRLYYALLANRGSKARVGMPFAFPAPESGHLRCLLRRTGVRGIATPFIK